MISKYLYGGIKYLFISGMIFLIFYGAIYGKSNLPIFFVKFMYVVTGMYLGFSMCLVIRRFNKE